MVGRIAPGRVPRVDRRLELLDEEAQVRIGATPSVERSLEQRAPGLGRQVRKETRRIVLRMAPRSAVVDADHDRRRDASLADQSRDRRRHVPRLPVPRDRRVEEHLPVVHVEHRQRRTTVVLGRKPDVDVARIDMGRRHGGDALDPPDGDRRQRLRDEGGDRDRQDEGEQRRSEQQRSDHGSRVRRIEAIRAVLTSRCMLASSGLVTSESVCTPGSRCTVTAVLMPKASHRPAPR